jgi:hypothetical protein
MPTSTCTGWTAQFEPAYPSEPYPSASLDGPGGSPHTDVDYAWCWLGVPPSQYKYRQISSYTVGGTTYITVYDAAHAGVDSSPTLGEVHVLNQAGAHVNGFTVRLTRLCSWTRYKWVSKFGEKCEYGLSVVGQGTGTPPAVPQE